MNPPSPLEATILRGGARLVSPGGPRGSLLVLIYHRVFAERDPLLADEPDAARFAAQMDLVAGMCNVLPLAVAVERLAAGTLPPRAAAITFDDGYANNLEVAAPILAARGLTATFFITTGFIDGGAMWNDLVIEAFRHARGELDLGPLGLGRFELADVAARRRAVDEVLEKLKYLERAERLRKAEAIVELAGVPAGRRLMMTEDELRRLAGMGMDIGAHCVTHPILARAPAELARREILESRSRLEAILGAPVRTFAYPNGRPGRDYGPEHVAMVRDAGFAAAVSTAWGAASRGCDPFQIPRLAPWDRSALRYGLRLVRGFTEKRAAVA